MKGQPTGFQGAAVLKDLGDSLKSDQLERDHATWFCTFNVRDLVAAAITRENSLLLSGNTTRITETLTRAILRSSLCVQARSTS